MPCPPRPVAAARIDALDRSGRNIAHATSDNRIFRAFGVPVINYGVQSPFRELATDASAPDPSDEPGQTDRFG